MPTLVVSDVDIHNQIVNEAEQFRKAHKYLEAVRAYMELAHMANNEYAFDEQHKFINQAMECFIEASQYFDWGDYAAEMRQAIQQRY